MVVVWGTVVVAGGATVVAASAGCCVLVEIGARLVRTLGVVRAVVVVVVAIGLWCGRRFIVRAKRLGKAVCPNHSEKNDTDHPSLATTEPGDATTK